MLFLENKWWGYGHDHPFYDTNSGVIADTNWNHIIVTYESGKMSIFVNGKLSAQRSMILNTIGNDFLIGVRPDVSWDNFFRGSIDDVRIYNRALTAAEVAQLYSKESGQPNTVLVQGGTLPVGSALAGQAVAPFHIARFETTWAEWKTVRTWAAANGYDIGTVGQGSADNHPVRNVNWYDAIKWLNAKSEMEGLTPVYVTTQTVFVFMADGSCVERKIEYLYKTGQTSYESINGLQLIGLQIENKPSANGYRLPMEAEWEFAARGGSLSQGFIYAGGNNINEVAVYRDNSINPSTVISDARGTWPVGTKNPNELGLYDMSGNLYEFCWELAGNFRRARSGSWLRDASTSSINYRNSLAPHDRNADYGFRYARNAIGDMVTVQGGTLPQSSALAGQAVQAFQIGKYEVTWGEWKTVRAWAVANGYTDLANVGAGSGDEHPVRNISWYDAVKWTNAKSQMEGLESFYTLNGTIYKIGQAAPIASASANGYRLPAEAEWEWAARGGVASHGYIFSGGNNLSDVGWYYVNSSGATVNLSNGRGTWPVGLKKPNELGIFDMSGNVWELCQDVVNNNSRRSRGGGWGDSDANGISVTRQGDDFPYDHKSYLGFRLARNIGPKISISGTMPEATLKQAYAGYTFTASGATTAPVWSVSSGSLPPGMSFNTTTATLSGTPTAAGNYTFIVKVVSGGYSDEVEVVLEIAVNGASDSDGDGVSNYREIQDATNPNDPTSFNQLSKGLVAFYPFNGNANDHSGNGNHGSLVGSSVAAYGALGAGESLHVDGSNNSWMEVPDNPNLRPVATTISIWIYNNLSDNSGVRYVCGKDYEQMEIHLSNAQNQQSGIRFIPRSGCYVDTVSGTPAQEWFHLVCIAGEGSDGAKIYINGSRVAVVKFGQFNGSEALETGDAPLLFGSRIDKGWPHLDGKIDNIRIYNRALSESEVTRLYSKESGQPNTVLVQGGALPAGSALAGQAVSPFQIAPFETTWAEWKAVHTWALANGYTFDNNGTGLTDAHPVANVSWYDVVKWCNAKSQMEGFLPVYQVSGATYKTGQSVPTPNASANGYRLPTENEWEWAARGGILSQSYTYSGSNDLNAVAWHSGNAGGGTKAIGSKAANELGIFDMSGNVFEWCFGDCRFRGGAWDANNADYFSVVRRNWGWPGSISTFGFRYARNATGDMVTIQGGTLPQSSALSGQSVQAFQIGRTETTWGEWKTVRAWAVANGYTDLANVGNGTVDNHPVQMLNWYDAVKWCNAKSEMEGLTPTYAFSGTTYKSGQAAAIANPAANGYRLPHRAEWEWAARGGASSLGYAFAGSNNADLVGWYSTNSGGNTKPIGLKAPNELGLYDMAGNVWEWCSENEGAKAYYSGGSWYNDLDYARLSYVAFDTPESRYDDYGFRLARNIGPKISISGTMPEPTLNQAFAGYTFTAVGATGAQVWSVSSGSLPPGMSFNATTATLSGTPTTAGNYTFTIQVASGGYSDEIEVVFEIADNNLTTNGNKALYFNNPTDVLNIDGSTIINDKMTIEAIVLFDSDTDGGGLFVEDWVGQGTPGQKNFNISPARLLGYVFPNDLSNGYFQPDVNLSVKSWHHVAFVLDGNQERFYVDGWLIASRSSNSGNVPDTNTCCMLGYGWKGYISSFRISNNARYSGSSHTPSFSKLTTDANTLLLYNFNEAPGSTTISDESGNNRSGRLGTVGPRSPSPTSPTFVTKEASMVSVQGGTLPSGSGLAGQVVQSFEIGRYEVTWAEWQTVRTYAIANGYDLTGVGNGTASTRPVQRVNWYDAVKWCNAKSQLEGLIPVYTVNGTVFKTGQVNPTQNTSANGYRLPSEKEWEWAARGGVLSQSYTYSGSNDVNAVMWYNGNSSGAAKTVGTKVANELGIYDMSGNMWEWCGDLFTTSSRRIRGGTFDDLFSDGAVSHRGYGGFMVNRYGNYGFRLARNY
jgi:formylglycine-generating enzyme required for sulfatase activity